MSKLVTLNGLNDEEILNDIFIDEIIVLEDIQGSKIWVNWDGKHFNIKPKSISNESINLIDLAMQNYYKPLTNVKIITDRLNHLYLKYLEPNTVMRMRVLSRNIRQQLSSYPYVKIHDRKMAFTISYIDSHRLPVTKNLIDEVQEYFAYKNWSESSESEVEM